MPEAVSRMEFKTVPEAVFTRYRVQIAERLAGLMARISVLEDRVAKIEDRPKRGRPRKVQDNPSDFGAG